MSGQGGSRSWSPGEAQETDGSVGLGSQAVP